MKNLWIAALAAVLLVSCGGRESQNRNKQTTKTEKKMGVQHLTKVEFLTKVANYEASPKEWKFLGDKPCIVDFYASWCGPCKMMAPVMETLAGEYEGRVKVYKVDVDKEKRLAALFKIRSIPTFILIPKEGEPQHANGAMDIAEMRRIIDTALLNKK